MQRIEVWFVSRSRFVLSGDGKWQLESSRSGFSVSIVNHHLDEWFGILL